MKLCWVTDIHLNFLECVERSQFYEDITASGADAVLISGDIAEAPSFSSLLLEMEKHIQVPIYFVLGNHDYYRGSIEKVRLEAAKLTQDKNHLFWLPRVSPLYLNDHTILVGEDGWADARLGDYANSRVRLNDSRLIADLFQCEIVDRKSLQTKMQALADHDAARLKENINKAISESNPKKIIVVTHVPPFQEACLHQGMPCALDYLPYFSSKASGDVLLDMAELYPTIEFLVLAGHTHERAVHQPLKNLTVQVGQAEYYRPGIEGIIIV